MKKITIKKIIFGITFLLFFSINFSFAQDSNTGPILTFFTGLKDLFHVVWIPFAIVAGKIYTNDFVYATFLGMDKVLWQIWQFSRAIANFTIGFILIVSIFMLFVGKTKNIFATIGKIGIASVLVNMSWFIVGALIDLSIILLVAVGSFPISLLSDSSLKPIEKMQYCSNIEIGIDLNKQTDNQVGRFFNCKDEEKKQSNTAGILKNMNSMSGPLLFMGASILQLDSNLDASLGNASSNSDANKALSISFIIHFLTIILFVLPIIILTVVGIIRIFWIWIYAAFSPLIVVDLIFGGKVAAKHKSFSFKNMIGLVFQPVIVVFAMGIALIFLATLQSSFAQNASGDDPAKKSLGVCDGSENSLCLDGKTVVTIEGTSMNKTIKESFGGFFGFIILTILTLVMMWGMLKLAFQSTEITRNVSDSMFKFAADSVKSVPFIPTGRGFVSVGALKMGLNKGLLTSGLQAQASQKADGVIDKINSMMGIDGVDLKSSDTPARTERIRTVRNFESAANLLSDFIKHTKEEYPDLIPSSSYRFQAVVGDMVRKMAEQSRDPSFYQILGLKDSDGNNITNPGEMFKQAEFQTFISGVISRPASIRNKTNIQDIVSITKAYSSPNTNIPISKIH